MKSSTRVEFEVLDETSNAVVARHPGRSFPGVLIQGDTLRSVLDDIEELQEEAMKCKCSAAEEIVRALRERFTDLLLRYEKALRKKGRDLPYAKPVTK